MQWVGLHIVFRVGGLSVELELVVPGVALTSCLSLQVSGLLSADRG